MKHAACLVFFLASLAPHLFAEPPQIVGAQSGKEGAYFNFFIKSAKPEADGNLVITAVALDGKEPVSFELVIGMRWESPAAATPKEELEKLRALGIGKSVDPALAESVKKMRNGRVAFRSVGAPTEAFVRAVARTLRVRMPKFEFSEAEFHAVSVGAHPSKMQLEPLDLKLTHGAMDQKVFAMLVCHIDIPNRFVQLQEEFPKERAWREGLVTVLTQPARRDGREPR